MPTSFHGTLKYTCDVLGFIFRSFDPIEIITTEPWSEKVVVECRNETPIEITVTFASAPSAETILILGRVISRTVVGRIALRYGLCIQEPLLASHELVEEKDGTSQRVLAVSAPLSISGKESKSLTPQEMADLKADLEDLRPNRESYEQLYRIAMKSVDNVDRFMSLYRILSLLCPDASGKERQEFVDIFIEQESSEKRAHSRPDKSSIKETIFSKLRNEVGHARKGVDLSDTRKQMDQWVYELAKIAKKAIELKT